MEMMIIGGAIVVVGGLVVLFIFVEKQLAQKLAAGVVTLYLGLIGAIYLMAQSEMRDASFNKSKIEHQLEFERARQDFDRKFSGTQDEDKLAKGILDQERFAQLEKDLADAKEKEKSKIERAEAVSQATQLELERLRSKAKQKVDQSSDDILPGDKK